MGEKRRLSDEALTDQVEQEEEEEEEDEVRCDRTVN
jgi:hypothetical protein